MPEPTIPCILDFIPVIFDRSWFTVGTLLAFMLIIAAVGSQESYVKGFVNLMEVSIAAEVESVVVALLGNLGN